MGAVLDLLDQIVEMMGNERLEFEVFTGVLETGLAELKMGLVPPALDQVLVGNMDRTRPTGVKYAFCLDLMKVLCLRSLRKMEFSRKVNAPY